MMMVDYKCMINTIKEIKKFEDMASKSSMDKRVHTQLAMLKLADEFETWAISMRFNANLITKGLVRSVLKDAM